MSHPDPSRHTLSLAKYGIEVQEVLRNPSTALMYEYALRFEPDDSALSVQGALMARSGAKTGRSPTDKRIVEIPGVTDDVFWASDACVQLSEASFAINKERATDYLNTKERVFVIDAFAGWRESNRIKVRVICSRAYHAQFMTNMLIRPTEEQLAEFGEPDLVIFNAGQFPANRLTAGMTSKTSMDLNLATKEMVVLGSEYAGEMKKGVFTFMHFLMPRKGCLSLHCSANVSRDGSRTALMCGLSGTGKTTLSADASRNLIGDDEIVWSDDGVECIEGGCYAKAVSLSAELEPEIYSAIRYGAVLENVVYDPISREVDFDDTSITPNTRLSYPIEFVANAQPNCQAGHPSNMIMLTCDCFGVLPPVSRLTPEQASYHFISGFTAKVAGTEVGVTEPQATFSACFGEAFLVFHPSVYAGLLAKKMKQHGTNAWLVNTGWTGGPYGVGSRMKLPLTRAIINAIHDGSLAQEETEEMPVFGLAVPKHCNGVPDEVLNPRQTWADKEAYDAKLAQLAKMFNKNFEKFADGSPEEVIAAGPKAE